MLLLTTHTAPVWRIGARGAEAGRERDDALELLARADAQQCAHICAAHLSRSISVCAGRCSAWGAAPTSRSWAPASTKTSARPLPPTRMRVRVCMPLCSAHELKCCPAVLPARRKTEVFSFSQSMKLNASMPPSVMRANCACRGAPHTHTTAACATSHNTLTPRWSLLQFTTFRSVPPTAWAPSWCSTSRAS